MQLMKEYLKKEGGTIYLAFIHGTGYYVMDRNMRESVRFLERTRHLETLFTGGDVAWTSDGATLYAARNECVMAVQVDRPLESWRLGDASEGLKVSALCMNVTNTRLAVAYTSGLMREWEVTPSTSSGREMLCWRSSHAAAVLVMTYSPDSLQLATGSADSSIIVWEIASKKLLHKLRGTSVVSALLFAPPLIKSDEDESSRHCTLVCGHMDGAVRMFELTEEGAELRHDIKLHNSRITSILQDKSVGGVLICSRDHAASLIDPDSGIRKSTVPLFEAVEDGVLLPDGSLVTVGEEGKLKQWSVRGTKLLRSSQLTTLSLLSVHFNAHRNEFVVATADQNLIFVDAKTLTKKREIVGYHDEVFSVCFASDSDAYLVLGASSPEIRLYDVETFTCKLVSGHTDSVIHVVSASWDRRLIATCSKDNTVGLWRLHEANSTGEEASLSPLAQATGHTAYPSCAAFSATATRPFLLSVGGDFMLKMWSCAVIPKKAGEKLQETVHLTCSSTLKAHTKNINCVDVTPSNDLAVTGAMDKMAKLWKLNGEKGQLGIAGNFPLHKRGVWDAKFAPNGQKVATACGDGVLRIFSVAERDTLAVLEGHSSALLKVIFINNGSQILSADSGGIMKLWTVTTGVCDATIEAHTDKIWSVAASRDESVYLSAGSDGDLLLWADRSEERAEEERKKQTEHIQQVQTLDNLMADEHFADALKYALSLDRPLAAYKVVSRLGDDSTLREAVARLDQRELLVLLQFSSKWNTNSRTANAAAMALESILYLVPPEELLEIPHFGTVLFDLIPYVKRHFDRWNQKRQKLTFLEYAYSQMRPFG